MSTIRSDVSALCRYCERLLSEHISPPLTDDEEQLIAYYIDEMTRRFVTKPRSIANGVLPTSLQSVARSGECS
jgi:hypothetical protein